jgi:hypothetical protein
MYYWLAPTTAEARGAPQTLLLLLPVLLEPLTSCSLLHIPCWRPSTSSSGVRLCIAARGRQALKPVRACPVKTMLAPFPRSPVSDVAAGLAQVLLVWLLLLLLLLRATLCPAGLPAKAVSLLRVLLVLHLEVLLLLLLLLEGRGYQ